VPQTLSLLSTCTHQDSTAYEAFCKSINSGALIHHNLLGMLDSAEEKQQRYAAVYSLYELVFPPAPVAEIWPAPIAAPALAPAPAPPAVAAAGQGAASNNITIIVKAHNGEETIFRVKPHIKLSKVFNAYAAHANMCIEIPA
jgi:hypothetical protein